MTEQQSIYHLALRELHEGNGASFAVRSGWSLPMHYGDPRAEYDALRSAAVVYDRSYRTRFMVSGTDAEEVLSAAFAGHIGDLDEGRSLRTVALDETGNIRDIVLISRTGGIAYQVVGEPTQRQQTLARLQSAVGPDYDVRIDDRTDTTCLIGIAGPTAADAVARHLSDQLPPRLPLLHSAVFEYHGFRMMAVRASDIGEDGFEFVVAPAVGQHLIELLGEAGVPLLGFEAFETARVETCTPAYVPDLEPGLSPAEADIDTLLGIPGGAEGRILSAVLLEGEAAATGTPVTHEGRNVGEVRSSLHSLALNAPVALAIIEASVALPGAALDVGGVPGTIVAKPFYRRRG